MTEKTLAIITVIIMVLAAAAIGWVSGSYRAGKKEREKWQAEIAGLREQGLYFSTNMTKWKDRAMICFRAISYIAHPPENLAGTLDTFKAANQYRKQKALETMDTLEATMKKADPEPVTGETKETVMVSEADPGEGKSKSGESNE